MSAILGPHVTHTGRNPCPKCGGDNCVTFEDGATLCLRVESSHRTKSGIGWMHSIEHNAWEAIPPLPPPAPEQPADPAILDSGIRAILSACPLTPEHHNELLRRGLAEVEISMLPVGSLPAGPSRDEVAAAIVAKIGSVAYGNIPGLYRTEEKPQLRGHSGLLVGVPRGDRLVGLVVRPDDLAVRASGKYRWISSTSWDGGRGSGAPCGFIAGASSSRRVVVTEGILKGTIVARRLGLPVVCMPGATITAEVSAILSELDAAEVVLAFDNDRTTNPHVAAAEAGLISLLIDRGMKLLRATWPEDHKGLDDALAAGVLPLLEPVSPVAVCTDVLADLREQLERTQDLYRWHLAASRSPNLGPERSTATAIIADLAHCPDGEFAPMPHARTARNAGVSERVARTHVERLKPILAGKVEFQKRWVPETINQSTGEIRGGHEMTYARLLVAAPDALRAIATAPEPTSGKRNGHGGTRCPKCGGTEIVRHWEDRCAGCGEVLARGKKRQGMRQGQDDRHCDRTGGDQSVTQSDVISGGERI